MNVLTSKAKVQEVSMRNDGAKALSPLPVKSQPTSHGNIPTETHGLWKDC